MNNDNLPKENPEGAISLEIQIIQVVAQLLHNFNEGEKAALAAGEAVPAAFWATNVTDMNSGNERGIQITIGPKDFYRVASEAKSKLILPDGSNS